METLLNNPWGPVVATDDGTQQAAPFHFDFVLEGKAQGDQVVTEEENGDLMIEGWAAVFEGVDRQNENFADGAFKRGIKSFIEGTAALCYHHKADHGIGRVLNLDEVEGKGLWMKARVDHQPESSPLRYIYNGVKKGTYRGLSVGGFFRRKVTAAGQRIADMDFTEISVTPVPVHPGTSLSVVAGKAFEGVNVPPIEEDLRAEDEESLRYAVEAIERIVRQLERRGKGSERSTDDAVTV